jgi:hypothetical protein
MLPYRRIFLPACTTFVHIAVDRTVSPIGEEKSIMGTKRTSSEGAVKKAAKLPPKRKVVARTKSTETAVRATKPKPEAKATEKPASPVVSTDLVALRAYFISEKRIADGIEGDALTDWLEAERQILAENR